MVKVQPFFKEPTPTGVLSRRIRILSKFYILPLNFVGDAVKFSIFSWKTLIHIILHSTPFLISLIWTILQPSNVYGKIFEAFASVYTSGDILVMAIFPGTMLLPVASITFTFIFCCSLPSLPDLVHDPNLEKPGNYKRLIGSRILELTGHFLVTYGNCLALRSYLPFNQLEMITYVFLPMIIPASINSSIIAFLVVAVFGIMENLLFKMKHCPREGVIAWIQGNIDLFQRYQKAVNLMMLGFITSR